MECREKCLVREQEKERTVYWKFLISDISVGEEWVWSQFHSFNSYYSAESKKGKRANPTVELLKNIQKQEFRTHLHSTIMLNYGTKAEPKKSEKVS